MLPIMLIIGLFHILSSNKMLFLLDYGYCSMIIMMELEYFW